MQFAHVSNPAHGFFSFCLLTSVSLNLYIHQSQITLPTDKSAAFLSFLNLHAYILPVLPDKFGLCMCFFFFSFFLPPSPPIAYWGPNIPGIVASLFIVSESNFFQSLCVELLRKKKGLCKSTHRISFVVIIVSSSSSSLSNPCCLPLSCTSHPAVLFETTMKTKIYIVVLKHKAPSSMREKGKGTVIIILDILSSPSHNHQPSHTNQPCWNHHNATFSLRWDVL